MYYMNRETGEILSYHEMIEQAKQDYDYGDDTNLIGLNEYYERVRI